MLTAVTSTFAGPDCSNPKHQDKPACAGGSITYTAYTTGAFVFGPIEVFLNSRENQFSRELELTMSPQPNNPNNILTWDGVFNTCELLNDVNGFEADDWYIGKPGGVRVMFRDFPLPYYYQGDYIHDGAVITVQLISDEFDFVDDYKKFPPEPGEISIFDLKDFVIWGNTAKGEPGPRRACQPPGGGGADTYPLFDQGSTKLHIKATVTSPP